MDSVSIRRARGERVYQAIKAQVIAYAFPQGRRIYLQPLADQMGISTTPVREALDRLAAEGLVIKAQRKGYVALRLAEVDLPGYCEITRLLLVRELEGLDTAARRRLPEYEPIADVLYKLTRRSISRVDTLATYTGEVFARIAAVGGNAHVVRAVERANDHLYYIRTLECEHRDDVQDELVLLCELVLAGRCAELIQVVQRHLDRRRELLPTLLDIARRRECRRDSK